MAVSKDNTEEIKLVDLIPGPPVPSRSGLPGPAEVKLAALRPGSTPASAKSSVPAVSAVPAPKPPRKDPPENPRSTSTPTPADESDPPAPDGPSRTPSATVTAHSALRQPWRRLWRVYVVTSRVVASYFWLRFRVWLGGEETREYFTETLPYPDEKAVAGLLTKALIDFLEAINAHVENRHLDSSRTPSLQDPSHAVSQEGPVREAGQLVMKGQITELILGPAAIVYISLRSGHP